jgi:Rrf2 family protein
MLSKTSKYGLKATTYMVSHHEAGKLFKVEELSTELQIPKHFLAKVMLDLTKKGILSSVKGPRGGFYFSDIQLEFTPADVIFALENDDFLRTCIMEQVFRYQTGDHFGIAVQYIQGSHQYILKL